MWALSSRSPPTSPCRPGDRNTMVRSSLSAARGIVEGSSGPWARESAISLAWGFSGRCWSCSLGARSRRPSTCGATRAGNARSPARARDRIRGLAAVQVLTIRCRGSSGSTSRTPACSPAWRTRDTLSGPERGRRLRESRWRESVGQWLPACCRDPCGLTGQGSLAHSGSGSTWRDMLHFGVAYTHGMCSRSCSCRSQDHAGPSGTLAMVTGVRACLPRHLGCKPALPFLMSERSVDRSRGCGATRAGCRGRVVHVDAASALHLLMIALGMLWLVAPDITRSAWARARSDRRADPALWCSLHDEPCLESRSGLARSVGKPGSSGSLAVSLVTNVCLVFWCVPVGHRRAVAILASRTAPDSSRSRPPRPSPASRLAPGSGPSWPRGSFLAHDRRTQRRAARSRPGLGPVAASGVDPWRGRGSACT